MPSSIEDLITKGVNHYSFYQPEKPADEQGDMSRGFEKAMRQIPQTAGGAAALVGDLVGSDGLKDYGLGVYKKQDEAIQKITKPSDSFSSVLEGEGSPIDFLQSGIGYVGGQALTALATGGAGGFIGAQLAKQGAKQAIARGVAEQVAAQAVKRGAIMGAGTAAFGSNLVQEAGSIYPEALQQAETEGRTLDGMDKARIVGSSLAAAGVDTAMEGVMAGRLLHGGRKAGESMVRAATREVPLAMAREGATEGIQTGIERFGAGQDLTTADAIRDYVDSAALGALGGGLGGGASVLNAQKVPEAGPLSRAANAGIDEQILQLTHDPQPLISFPDGSVGHKQDLAAYLSQFTDPEERQAKEREIMGRDPKTGKKLEAEPAPEPVMADNEASSDANIKAWSQRHDAVPLDYAQALIAAPGAKGLDLMIAPHASGKGYTVVPSKWLSLDAQARAGALQKGDAARLPSPDMEAPAGAIRVDSEGGAAPETYAEQARTKATNQAAAQKREELDVMVPRGAAPAAPSTQPEEVANAALNDAADRVLGGTDRAVSGAGPDSAGGMGGDAQPGTGLQPGGGPLLPGRAGPVGRADGSAELILTAKGEPFKAKVAAINKQRALGTDSHEVIAVPGGYAVKPKEAISANGSQIAVESAKVGTSEPVPMEAAPVAEGVDSSTKLEPVVEAKAAVPLDHGVLNVPLAKRGNIDAQIDKYKAEKEAEEARGIKAARIKHKELKTQASTLLDEHLPAILERHGPKFGKANLRQTMKDMASIEPAKFVKFVEKFQAEAAEQPSSPVSGAAPKKSSTGAQVSRDRLKATDPFLAFLAEHGVSSEDRADTGADKSRQGNRLIPGYGPVFRKNGLRLDELVTRAVEAGHLSQADVEDAKDNGGVNKLADMIQRSVQNREVIIPAAKVDQVAEAQADDRANMELRDEANRLGIDGYQDMDPDALYDAVRTKHAEQVDAQSDGEYDAIEQDADALEDAGITDAEINALAQIAANENKLTNEDLYAQFALHSAEEVRARAAAGDDTGASGKSAQGTEAAPGSKGSGPAGDVQATDGFGLTGETADEARSRLAAEEKAAKDAAKADRDAKEADRAAQAKKEIAARQDASAENFQLGQSAEDGLSGQADMLGRGGSNDQIDPFDRTLLLDIAMGKGTKDVLSRIAAESANPQYRELAKSLMAANLKTTIEFGDSTGAKFAVKGIAAAKFAAGYKPKADQVLLFMPKGAEVSILHELTHAATFKAIRSGGLAARQMTDLYHHVEQTGTMKGLYAMENLDEFVAEAFSNPQIQGMLRDITAMPKGSAFRNAWDKFVAIVRGILGLKNATTLDQVMQAGAALMQENAAIRASEQEAMAGRSTEQAGETVLGSIGATLNGYISNKAEQRSAYLGEMSAAQETAARNIGAIVTPQSLAERFAQARSTFSKGFVQGVADQFAAIKDLDPKAYLLARMSKASDGTLEAAMMYGKPFLRDGVADVDIKDGGFAKVLASLDGEHDRFLLWVAAQRAERLKGEGKENLFTTSDISALKTLNVSDKQHPERAMKFAKALREMNAFNDAVLKVAQESGLLDQAAVDLFKDQPYVPFYRVMEEEGGVNGPTFSAGLVNQKAFQKLKGGTDKLNQDLLSNLLQNWSHLYSAAAKNRAAQATMKAAMPLGIVAEVPAGTKESVRVFQDGKAKSYTIDDPHLYQAVSAMEQATPKWFKPFSTFKRVLTTGVTINPTFKIRNLIRDSIAAIGTGDLSYNPLKNVSSGFKATAKDSQTYASMLASGGIIRFGNMLDGGTADVAHRLIAKGIDKNTILDESGFKRLQRMAMDVGHAYNELGDRLENVNRAALYEQMIAKGYSHADASFAARDLLDFTMQGRWPVIRFLTQSVPFMNARIQGLYKLGRAAKEDPRRMGYVVGGVALASLALLWAYGDDEDWKKREDFDRDNSWWFKIGNTAFRIPKPFEIGAIGTIAERAWELGTDKEMTASRFGKRAADIIFQQFALNPVPQIVKPLMDVYSNKDAFTARPIESMGMERLRPQDRVTDRTSNVARFLGAMGLPDISQLPMGRYAPLSPVQIDYLIKGYFGWMGTAALTATNYLTAPIDGRGEKPDLKLRDTFIAGNFAESLPSGSSRYLTQMYEQSKEVEQAYASYHAALKSGDVEGAQKILADDGDKIRKYRTVEAEKKQVSQINTQIKRIEANKAMSGEAKRMRIDALEQQRNQAARRL